MNSSELRGYLTGLILGGGHIDKGIQKRAFEIKSINQDFIEKIEKDINESTNFTVVVKEFPEYTSNDSVCHKKSWSLRIKAHPYFSKRYSYFYTDTKKRRITAESMEWINISGIANWYMSDGYVCLVGKNSGIIKDRRVDICTDRYTFNDVKKIEKMLTERFGWKCKTLKHRDSYRIRVSLISAQDMFVKIFPYITESFYYKLDLKYDTRPAWMSDEYFELMSKIQKRKRPQTVGNDIV